MPPANAPQGYLPPPTGPQGRTVLIVVLVVGAVILLITALLVVLVMTRGGGGDDDPSTGPATLREPLRLQLVAEASAPPCASGALRSIDDSECLRVTSEAAMVVQRVEGMRAEPPNVQQGQRSWTVNISLTSADAAKFGTLSGLAYRRYQQDASSPGSRIAMVVGERVQSAPQVNSGAITGGKISLTGPPAEFTEQRTRDLVRRLTGRQP